MPKQKRDAEATKAKIIENAMILFSKKGYDATTADDVAAACGINKAMIFYYYKNKAGLYEAVMSKALSAIHEKVITSEKCCASPLADLEAFIRTYADYCEQNPYLPALLLRELSSSGHQLPEQMFVSMRRLFTLLSSILAAGEGQGLFKKSQPMILYFMIVGTMNLMITTRPLRERAAQMQEGLNTCSDCSMDEIAEEIFRQTKLMLEVHDETNPTCA